MGLWYESTLEAALAEAKRLANVRMQDMAIVESDGQFIIGTYNKIRTKFPSESRWDVPCFAVWHSGR